MSSPQNTDLLPYTSAKLQNMTLASNLMRKLLPAQFETIIFSSGINSSELPGSGSPMMERILAFLRAYSVSDNWVENLASLMPPPLARTFRQQRVPDVQEPAPPNIANIGVLNVSQGGVGLHFQGGFQAPPARKPTLRDMRNLRFTNTDLVGEDYSEADLTGSKFVGCKLMGVSFRGSNLTNVHMTGCNLTQSDFRDLVSRKGSHQIGCTMTGVKW